MNEDKKEYSTYSPRVLKGLGIWAPIPLAVLSDTKLPANAKLLYGLLQQMNFNNKQKDKVWPSQFLLRGYLGLGRTQIVKLLKKLEDRGLIEIEKKKNPGRINNLYTLLPLEYAYGGQWAREFRVGEWIDFAYYQIALRLTNSERDEAKWLLDDHIKRVNRLETNIRAYNHIRKSTSTEAEDEIPFQ